MRILLVEDDELLGYAVERALKDDGHAVDWVRDGESALSSLYLEAYSLVLLDLGLPIKDGLEVLETMRKAKKIMPVIILTARDSIEDRIKGLDLGADDYLVKPFSIDELHARIRAVVRRNQGAADPVLKSALLQLNTTTKAVEVADEFFSLSAKE